MSYNNSRLRSKLQNHSPRSDGKRCDTCASFKQIIFNMSFGVLSGRCKILNINKDGFDYCGEWNEKNNKP